MFRCKASVSPASPAAPPRAAALRTLALSAAFAALLLLLLWLFRGKLRALWLRHRRLEEIRRCRAYIDERPDSDEAAALQYKVARIHQESLRDHARAIVEFKRFLERHAAHPLAENARYYLARSWEELGNPARAQLEFARLIKRHPGGVREADARLRIEELAARLGENLSDAPLPDDPDDFAPPPAPGGTSATS